MQQHLRTLIGRWVVATLGTSLIALPVAAAVHPQAAIAARWEVAAILCAGAIVSAEQMLRNMRELKQLDVMRASAESATVPQHELEQIRHDLRNLLREERCLSEPMRSRTS